VQVAESASLSTPVPVELLAARYLEAIRTLQPSGPYRLAGWSFGGTLAYEIAHQLRNLREPVEFVGLIDTAVRYEPDAAHSLVNQDVLALAYYVQSPDTRVDETALKALLDCSNLRQALDFCQKKGFVPLTLSFDSIRGQINRTQQLSRAARDYEPPVASFAVHIFMAEDLNDNNGPQGWRALVANPHIETIGGTHSSIMEPPHVRRLATAVSDALEAARPRDMPDRAQVGEPG
jgi:thioesterase domain-containing protein